MDRFDESSHTYSGRIIVKYTLCDSDRYGPIATFDKVTAIVVFDKAKSPEDAKAQKQADVDKIITNLAGGAPLCPDR